MNNECLKILNTSDAVTCESFQINNVISYGLYSKYCKWEFEHKCDPKIINQWKPIRQSNAIKMPELTDGNAQCNLALHSYLCEDDQLKQINRHKNNFGLKQPLICIVQQNKWEIPVYAARQIHKNEICGIWITAPTSLDQSLKQCAKHMKHKNGYCHISKEEMLWIEHVLDLHQHVTVSIHQGATMK